MKQYTALLDANVLFPAPIRDLLLQLAAMDFFRGRWTADIHREWIEALLRNESHRDRAKLERTRDLMDQATHDCLVTGYEGLIPSLTLPDPDDRNVLEAAIVGRCDCIVTKNLRDFPTAALAPFGIETQHPDKFLLNQMNLAPGAFLSAVRKVRLRLKKNPLTATEYQSNLTWTGLVGTASELQAYEALI